MDFKRITAIILLSAMVMLTSCSVGEIIQSGAVDYSEESVIGSAAGNAAVVSELSEIIYALTIDSIKLPEFSDTASAISKCGDSLLNHLLTTNYSRFSGSTEVLKNASEKYPHLGITAAIGASDYEGALYKYFNHGGNIRHSDTSRFRYLSKIEAYIPAVQTIANSFSLDIVAIDETPSTYRMTFYCAEGDEVSQEYYAVFVKRDKGGCYIQSIRTVASEKVSYTVPEVFS
ncbi:MAG: hypothetical protein IJZ89_08485 [Clostridia bacterium]|nr:hypothetical protein [Clostridia bacterium]